MKYSKWRQKYEPELEELWNSGERKNHINFESFCRAMYRERMENGDA